MKRLFIVIILIVSMTFCFTACTDKAEGDKVKIGVIDTSISKDIVKEYKRSKIKFLKLILTMKLLN